MGRQLIKELNNKNEANKGGGDPPFLFHGKRDQRALYCPAPWNHNKRGKERLSEGEIEREKGLAGDGDDWWPVRCEPRYPTP